MTWTMTEMAVVALLASCITSVAYHHWQSTRWIYYVNQKNRRLLPPATIYVPHPYPKDTNNSDRDDRLVHRRYL
jgi:hypothetical protein